MFNPFLFKGFDPSAEFNTASNVVLSGALEIAPEDAIAFGYIVKEGAVFWGHLEICSSCGVFSAYARADNEEKVLDTLRRKIFRRLKKWKRSYFPPLPAESPARAVA